MSFICHIDLETFSKTPLKQAGVYRYAECYSTEILVFSYAFGDNPINCWIPDPLLPRSLQLQIARYVRKHGGLCHIGFKMPVSLRWHARNGGQFRAHNSQFERTILNGRPGKNLRFPPTKRSQWVCTAAKAAAHSLPRDLDRACKAIGTEHQKSENGRGDMLRLSKPRKPSKNNPMTRWLPNDVPEKFYNLYTYCMDDVYAERDLDHAVPDLSKSEQRLFLLDQKINDRGWKVDLERVADVQTLISDYKARLQKKMRNLVGVNPTQREKVSVWIRNQGVHIDNLQAQTIKDTLKRKDLAQEVRWVLRIYSLFNTKAVSKFTAMERAVCADGRLRGMFLFYGASTGRWSSLIVQLQNLFRPIIDDPELAIEAFRERSIGWIKLLYDKNPMKVFASCVRGMLIPGVGRDLLFADFKSIEARITAWLAGQLDILKIFETHGLVYEYTAARMFGHPTNLEHLKTFKERFPKLCFLGKICLGGDTLVLTMEGWKRIIHVLETDKLWDGQKWVNHQGLIYRGKKHSLYAHGIAMTVEHEILTGRSWKTWGAVLRQPKLFRSALDSASLPSSDIVNVLQMKAKSGDGNLSPNVLVEIQIPTLTQIFEVANLRDATYVPKLKQAQNDIGNTEKQCQKKNTEGVYVTGFHLQLEDVTKNQMQHINIMENGGYLYAKRGVKIEQNFFDTFVNLKGGMILIWKWIGKIITKVINPVISALQQELKTQVIKDELKILKKKIDVYDLLSAGPRKRFTILTNKGPLIVHNCVLALGYQGGGAAFVKMAKQYGMDVDFEQGEQIKWDWRDANPMIVEMWDNVSIAAYAAVENPGTIYRANKLMFRVDGDYLHMRLPSKQTLKYFEPKIVNEEITYVGIDTYTRQWKRCKTYGGKLVQNAAERIARDLMKLAMFKLNKKKYPILGTVHDEIIMEPREGFGSVNEVCAMMCDKPEWAKDLPVDAVGFRAKRYRK